MVKSFTHTATAAGLALLAATPVAAMAEDEMVSATDLEAVAKTMRQAGYDAEIKTFDDGKREIALEFGDWNGAVMPSDCEGDDNKTCQTLILSAGFDRETPLSAERVAAANRNHRYVSVWTDDEGDPYVQWAILTRDVGIPKQVFLNALVRFSGVLNDFGSTVFDDDTPQSPAVSASRDSNSAP